MSDISKKSIGMLIDELSICNVKSFFFQETIMNSADKEAVALAAKNAQEVNSRRSKLVKAIDDYFNDLNSPTTKTY